MVMSVYFLVGFCLTPECKVCVLNLFCVISLVGRDYQLSC